MRVGYHFIKYLEPGNFFGLDVIDAFFNIGKSKIGEEVLGAKLPQLAVISPDTIQAAAEFGADFIYLAGVAIHLHDDDAPEFFGNLDRLSNKPGMTLVMSVHIAESSFEHTPSNWARPIEYFVEMLPGLRLVKYHSTVSRPTPYGDYSIGYLEFSRP